MEELLFITTDRDQSGRPFWQESMELALEVTRELFEEASMRPDHRNLTGSTSQARAPRLLLIDAGSDADGEAPLEPGAPGHGCCMDGVGRWGGRRGLRMYGVGVL